MEESRKRIHEARRAADERAKTDPKCAVIRRASELERARQVQRTCRRAEEMFNELDRLLHFPPHLREGMRKVWRDVMG